MEYAACLAGWLRVAVNVPHRGSLLSTWPDRLKRRRRSILGNLINHRPSRNVKVGGVIC